MSLSIGNWLAWATKQLETKGIVTGRLDSLVLLEDCLKINRANLLAHAEDTITNKQLLKLNKQLLRRQTHEPLAYIRGKTEFYGRDFIINHNVLEPRPESETMIDELKNLELNKPSIADIGSGSGAIGITAALEIDHSNITLVEIDAKALMVANRNLKTFKLSANCQLSDILLGVDKSSNYDVLLCNLPYVPNGFKINQAAKHEPKIAIFGGQDGLDLYRKLFSQAIDHLALAPTYILTESFPSQHQELIKIAQASDYQQISENDFIQVFRFDR